MVMSETKRNLCSYLSVLGVCTFQNTQGNTKKRKRQEIVQSREPLVPVFEIWPWYKHLFWRNTFTGPYSLYNFTQFVMFSYTFLDNCSVYSLFLWFYFPYHLPYASLTVFQNFALIMFSRNQTFKRNGYFIYVSFTKPSICMCRLLLNRFYLYIYSIMICL